jgi:hypothetical protein
MTPNELNTLDDVAYGLLFDVRRSVRYHDKRAAFFERLHRVGAALTILLAGSVLFDLARPGNTPWWMLGLALLASLLSVLDLVFGLSRYAQTHRELQRRFALLERTMVAGPSTGPCWAGYLSERLLIELDEPSVYKMLDTLCHNEMLLALGHARSGGHYVKVSWWQSATCQIWPWSGAFARA